MNPVNNPDPNHEYKEREIEAMPERTFRLGEGRISGYIASFLGVGCFLAVLCFQFPEYLTTTELREAYDGEFLRKVLKFCMFATLAFALLAFTLGAKKRQPAIGVLFVAMGFALGGYNIPVGEVEAKTFSLGVDWLVLAFLVSAILFIFLEKVFPKYKEQPILRPEWSLDLFYFTFNHLMLSVLLFVGNYFVANVFGWAVSDAFQAWLQATPTWVQVIILLFCADFVLYWSHRTFHENPRLWKIHAVHHSVEHMDWMAGSRNHVIQMFVDRCLAMVPLYLLGASKEALDIYVAIAAFQAVYVHANMHIPVGPLKYIFCTPQYHHWHHSSEAPAIDTNYAVHMPFYDILFGTYHMPGEHWPTKYGTTRPIPKTFIGQLLHPFRK